jgi:hypothetical protein
LIISRIKATAALVPKEGTASRKKDLLSKQLQLFINLARVLEEE